MCRSPQPGHGSMSLTRRSAGDRSARLECRSTGDDNPCPECRAAELRHYSGDGALRLGSRSSQPRYRSLRINRISGPATCHAVVRLQRQQLAHSNESVLLLHLPAMRWRSVCGAGRPTPEPQDPECSWTWDLLVIAVAVLHFCRQGRANQIGYFVPLPQHA